MLMLRALGDHLLDRREALGGAGIFTYRFGWSMSSCSCRAAAMVPSVSRARLGRHLDRHEAVVAVALVVHRTQDVAARRGCRW